MAGPKGRMPEDLRKERDEKKSKKPKLVKRPKESSVAQDKNNLDNMYAAYVENRLNSYLKEPFPVDFLGSTALLDYNSALKEYNLKKEDYHIHGNEIFEKTKKKDDLNQQLGIVNYSGTGPNNYWSKQNEKVLRGFNLKELMKFDTDHNSSISNEEIKAMLKQLGLVADGKLGSNSIARLKSYLLGDAYNKLKTFENPLAKQRRIAREKKELEDAKGIVSDALIEAANISSNFYPSRYTKDKFYSADNPFIDAFKESQVAPIFGYYPNPDDSTGVETYAKFIQEPSRIDSAYLKLNDSTLVTLDNWRDIDSIPKYIYNVWDPRIPGDSSFLSNHYPYLVNDFVIPVSDAKQILDYARRFKQLGTGLRDTYKGFKPDTINNDTLRADTLLASTMRPDSIPSDTARTDSSKVNITRRDTARTERPDSTKKDTAKTKLIPKNK